MLRSPFWYYVLNTFNLFPDGVVKLHFRQLPYPGHLTEGPSGRNHQDSKLGPSTVILAQLLHKLPPPLPSQNSFFLYGAHRREGKSFPMTHMVKGERLYLRRGDASLSREAHPSPHARSTDWRERRQKEHCLEPEVLTDLIITEEVNLTSKGCAKEVCCAKIYNSTMRFKSCDCG